MGTVEKWLVGLTTVAVVSTLVSSPYSANVINAIGNVIAGGYKAAKG